jgi:hypothetical protein
LWYSLGSKGVIAAIRYVYLCYHSFYSFRLSAVKCRRPPTEGTMRISSLAMRAMLCRIL